MKIATIKELQAIRSSDNGEPLVYFQSVLVRKTVAQKLSHAQEQLAERNLELLVVEGHRSHALQEKYFLKELLREYARDPTIEFELLLERTHARIALPSVAGHPTGGAVDITLLEIDMGGEVRDFSNPELLPTYSPSASSHQINMRKLLHDAMVSVGFAPFYGEWWHFSYGDREWASFCGKSESLYAGL